MNGVIYGNITNMTPLYNFIDDSYFAKMPVLRHLSQRLILSGFRLSPRKWQKLPGCEFLRLGQIWNPEHFYSCSRQICHRHKAKASLRHSWYLSDWSAFRFLCGCAPCNCIKTRMFSAHNNSLRYSIGVNIKIMVYTASNHCQSDLMELFHAMHRKSPDVQVKPYWKTSVSHRHLLRLMWHTRGLLWLRKDF